jgi:hypothetical protein
VTRPTAVVLDGFGNPVPGVLVTFSGLTGGGSAGGTSVSTNAGGLATLGSWTMGNTAGDDALGRFSNTIGASASGTGTATVTDYGIFTWAGDAAPLISTASGCNGCHYANWTVSPNTIVGVASHTNSAPYVCQGYTLVTSGSAGASLMYLKLAGAPCGSQMPLGGPVFSAANLQKVRAWINNGALNN